MCHFDTEVPDAYCVYSPLAVASLSHLLGTYEIDVSATLILSVDYLEGLSFLHKKGIMHRDVNPNNLAVTSFKDPRGLIIDLDSATTHKTSTDHMQGTLVYLGPEIISLKDQQQQLVGYGKSVDIWVIALSMHTGEPFRWAYFGPPGRQSFNVVTAELHTEFHRRIN